MADFKVSFNSDTEEHRVYFGEVYNISDGGYERGYAEGYAKGYAEALKQSGGDSEITTSILGFAVLGNMILGG